MSGLATKIVAIALSYNQHDLQRESMEPVINAGVQKAVVLLSFDVAVDGDMLVHRTLERETPFLSAFLTEIHILFSRRLYEASSLAKACRCSRVQGSNAGSLSKGFEKKGRWERKCLLSEAQLRP